MIVEFLDQAGEGRALHLLLINCLNRRKASG
jgi:hypothetical protein